MADPIIYEACPLCKSKKVIRIETDTRIIIKCGNIEECGNRIDSFPKDEQK